MTRLPSNLGRFALWRPGQGGVYWTGDMVHGRPIMTRSVGQARVFASPTMAYSAARDKRGLLTCKPVRLP